MKGKDGYLVIKDGVKIEISCDEGDDCGMLLYQLAQSILIKNDNPKDAVKEFAALFGVKR